MEDTEQAATSSSDEPAPTQTTRSPVTTCLVIVSLGVAGLFYLLSVLLVFDIGSGGGDHHSRGLAQGLAILAQFILWIPLGLYVLLCIGSAPLPGWIKALGVGLVLLSAAGSATAVGMMSGPGLLAVPPIVLPVLAGMFGVWARTQAEAPPATLRRAAIGFAIVALPLVVGPFIAYGLWVAGEPERQAQWAREQAEQERRVRAELAAEEARFRALGPQSQLDDVLPYLESSHAEEAKALISTLATGEADTVRLLGAGIDLYRFEGLHEFGLEATPGLCRAYRARVDARLRETNPTRPDWPTVLYELQSQLPNLRWFMGEGCDVSPEARVLLAGVRRVQADYGLQDYARELEAILSLSAATPRTDP